MRSLDDTNLRLLDALLEDARMPVADLARRLDRSEATIRERVQRLEAEGILRGHRADIEAASVGLGVKAVVRASMDLRDVARVRKALAPVPQVVSADVVTGDQSLRLRLVARDLRDLQAVMHRHIAPLGFPRVDVRVVMNEIVPHRAPRLAALLAPEGPVPVTEG